MSPKLLSGAARLAGSSLLRLQSDERLLALVRDGHEPAFAAVVERYRGELLRYATRLVGESRAEDVVQQAFLNAHGAMTTSDSDIRLRPWLYRIAHNAGLNALRAGRTEEALDERLAAADTVESSAETRARLRDALAAIARLPEPQRDALTLQALGGRSHEEVAAALDITPGAARQHIHRARGAVRAAVTAVTPYGLLARFAMAGGGEPAASVALAGAGATVTKIGAGVLAAGAIATGTTGHVPFVGGKKDHARAVPAHSDTAVAAAASGDDAAASVPVPAAQGREAGDRARGHRSGRGGSGRRSGGEDRHGTPGVSDDGRDDHSGGGEVERHSSSGGNDRRGSDDGREGSDDHITAPATSEGAHSGGSDDREESASSGSGSSGSGDDGLSGKSGGSDDSGTETTKSGDSGSGSDDSLSGEIDGSGSGSGSSGSGSGSDDTPELDDD